MKRLLLCLLLAGCGESQPPPSSIIILAGQSNAVGYGVSSQVNAPLLPNVLMWDDGWKFYRPEDTFGPEHQFLIRWSQDHPNETLGIVKYAIGGTYMSDWDVIWTSPDNPQYGSLYQNLMSVYRESGSLPVKAFLWMQGEFDSLDSQHASMYQSRFELFVTTVQANLRAPFIFGLTQNNTFTQAEIATIRAAQLGVSTWPDVYIVQTDDLTVLDDVHFDTASQIEFGNRYYDVFDGI